MTEEQRKQLQAKDSRCDGANIQRHEGNANHQSPEEPLRTINGIRVNEAAYALYNASFAGRHEEEKAAAPQGAAMFR